MGKLVRDLIPLNIEAPGRVPKYRTFESEGYGHVFIDKLFEEAQEIRDATPENRPLADALPVVLALAAHLGFTDTTLNAVPADQRSERGGFEERIWLE